MKQRSLRKLDLEELLGAYAAAARNQCAATESGDYVAGNEASDKLTQIYAEIRRRGPEEQRALLSFLEHPDLGVRLWSASHALEFAPDCGQAVLRSLIPTGTFLGLCASTTLLEWQKGRLRFP